MGERDCSIILPAYNCDTIIKGSVEEILLWFRGRGLDGEVVVVDDGSRDATYAMVPQAQEVRTLKMPHNRGKGAAVRAGMLCATGNVRMYTDADLPYGTDAFVPALSAIVDEGYHAAIGDRTLHGSSYYQPALQRRLVSKIATWLIRTFVTDGLFDTQCGLKAFRADVAQALFKMTSIDGFAGDVEVVYLLLRHQLKFKRIPVVQRRETPSTIRLARDSLRAGIDIAALRIGRHADPHPLAELERSEPSAVERVRPDVQVDPREKPHA